MTETMVLAVVAAVSASGMIVIVVVPMPALVPVVIVMVIDVHLMVRRQHDGMAGMMGGVRPVVFAAELDAWLKDNGHALPPHVFIARDGESFEFLTE